MTSSLLSTSNIQLFGQKVDDLKVEIPSKPVPIENVRAAANFDVDITTTGDDVLEIFEKPKLKKGDRFLLLDQSDKFQNGIYVVDRKTAKSPYEIKKETINYGVIYRVERGRNKKRYFKASKDGKYVSFRGFSKKNIDQQPNPLGGNSFLNSQVVREDAGFAKIYGFSFEGIYTDLGKPALYLVHGDGEPFTSGRRRSRSPLGPEESGIGAAEFQFSNDLRVWEYDKGDFTVRLDLSAGMFEQVLLDFELDYDEHPMFGGGKVGGGKVGGGKVGGGKVGGGKVGGGKIGG